ncbi:MAG: peptidoglycan bridge formation glycyltransferase FemA/FemB family protein [Candidatus Aminicenantales bacterium]
MGAKPKPLDHGYIAQFDTINKQEWHIILNQLSDANIYQTWSYDAVRCGENNITHMVLRSGDKTVAAAQARLVSIPLLGQGAAYIRWAPVWQPRNQIPDPAIFQQALRSLRNEYVCRRGLILRIFPILYDDNSQIYTDILSIEGYTPVPRENRGRTIIMDISQPLDEVRKKLDQKWRNCLNKSERNNLEVIEGADDSFFADFIGLYRALLDRKKFPEPNDINEFRMIQRDLPPEYKMRIFLCHSDGVSSAGVICSLVGDTGIYLFGATNDEGMTNKGSYLLQWKAIQWMKNNECRYYNLNGINPIENPGGYHFKVGLSGKNGQDVKYLGRFDSYANERTAKLARAADRIFPSIKRAIKKIGIFK